MAGECHSAGRVPDVRGHRRDGEVPPDAVGAWDRLRAEIAAWRGTAIVSMEFLATTSSGDIERIVALGARAPSTGVIAFAWGGFAEDPAKVEGLVRGYRRLAEGKR